MAALIGWWAHWPLLRTLLPGLPAMPPAIALGIGLLCVAILLVWAPDPKAAWRWAATGLAGVVAALSLGLLMVRLALSDLASHRVLITAITGGETATELRPSFFFKRESAHHCLGGCCLGALTPTAAYVASMGCAGGARSGDAPNALRPS